MIRLKALPGGVVSAQRGKLRLALAVLVSITILLAGCKKSDNAGNITSTGNTNSESQTNTGINTSTAETIKGMADQQGQATMPDRGNFSVQYSNVQNPRYVQINEEYRRKRVLEQIADQLNAAIAIPENVVITFNECGQPNAFWNPRDRQIVMCYELMDQMAQDFKEVAQTQEELEQRVSGALTFAFIHELGHCLIDVLKLPSTGREEDAVDQLSTFVLVGLSGDEGEQMAISGALSWGIQYERLAKSGKTAAELDMLWADEHSMDGQRFYNILCWVFGHNPNKYMGMINKPLPEARAVRCPQEYSRLASAWLTLLKPYLKDGGAGAEAHTQPMGMGNNPQSPPSATPSSTPGGDGGHGGH
jgi:hypothetical protein